jgi:hypothetical protein
MLGCETVKHPAFGGGVFDISLRHSSRLFSTSGEEAEPAPEVTPDAFVSDGCAGCPLEQPARARMDAAITQCLRAMRGD